jgi:hypothetical protein
VAGEQVVWWRSCGCGGSGGEEEVVVRRSSGGVVRWCKESARWPVPLVPLS